jgi:3-deoxy-D-manno-octulosonic-acid transferase
MDPMPFLLDVAYLVILTLVSPFLFARSLRTGRYRRGWAAKLLGRAPVSPAGQPVAWFHGVSVGEVHLLGPVVAGFRARHPDWHVLVSSTTDTGLAEAAKRFAGLTVFAWPLDFSWAVRRAVARVRPTLLVLAEGEMWPNMLRGAKRAGVRVAVVNARMSPRSFGRYRRVSRIARRMLFRFVDRFAVQTNEYAANLLKLGVPADRLTVTGSVKYDGVLGDRAHPRVRVMARLLGVTAGDLVWVLGSTQPPEEEIALTIFQRFKPEYPRLRLILVPRQPDRFNEVAELLRRSGVSFARRSEFGEAPPEPAAVVLVDTIGELGAVWGLADVAFVGGSLDGNRGGQNMIEPAAYGSAVLFGPHVWNFRDPVRRLLEVGGAVQVRDAAELESAVGRLLEDVDERRRLGEAARELVRQQQGATARTLDVLDGLIGGARANAG